MKQMAEFVTKLEGYADLEVSIIRTTKINKVLKAILKLPVIPKEEEFKFKPRSQTLLDKWNKLLASDTPAPTSATTNGVNTEVKGEAEESKASPTTATNGTKESSAEVKAEAKLEEKAEKPTDETASASELAPEVKEDTAKAETPQWDGLTNVCLLSPIESEEKANLYYRNRLKNLLLSNPLPRWLIYGYDFHLTMVRSCSSIPQLIPSTDQ